MLVRHCKTQKCGAFSALWRGRRLCATLFIVSEYSWNQQLQHDKIDKITSPTRFHRVSRSLSHPFFTTATASISIRKP